MTTKTKYILISLTAYKNALKWAFISGKNDVSEKYFKETLENAVKNLKVHNDN